MNRPTPDLDKAQAQGLMSQLLDGELAPVDAARLQVYLEQHPTDIDWMEGMELIQNSDTRNALAIERAAPSVAIIEAIARETLAPFQSPAPTRKQRSYFGPAMFAAAAAIALTGGLLWFGLGGSNAKTKDTLYASQSSVVEFVSTDIPDASTFVYTDNESGWTVVWVEAIDTRPIPKNG